MVNDIQGQLESLLNEVRLLSRSVVHLRQDDFRLVFGEQIKPILIERIDRRFGAEATQPDERLRAELIGLVGRFVDEFQRGGTEGASVILDEFEAGRLASAREDHAEPVAELVRQMRDYLVMSERVSSHPGIVYPAGSPTSKSPRTLSPTLVERTLGPLSSARRIDLLLALSRDDESLAELSRELAMKKGHLQFHLKVLIEGGYIAYDRKSHLYSLTPRGVKALDALTLFFEQLASA